MPNIKILRKHPNLSTAYRIIFKALLTNSALEIIKAGYDLFNLPIIVTDTNYQLIAMWPLVKIDNDIWDSYFDNKGLTEEIIRKYQETLLTDKDTHYLPFYSNDELVKSCPRIFGEIFDDKKVYGHLAIFMFDNELCKDDLLMVQIIVDALRSVLSKNQDNDFSDFSFKLHTLLEEDSPSDKTYAAAKAIESRIRGDYAVMVTTLDGSASLHAFASMDLSKIYPFLRYSITTVYNNCLITLVGLMKRKKLDEKDITFFKNLNDSLNIPNSHTGVSEIFSNLNEAKEMYFQALATAKLNKKPIDFFEIAYPQPLFTLIKLKHDINYFIRRDLISLSEQDKINGTEYFKTLKIFLFNFKDHLKTASDLFIHRNTLLYRLNKIEKILNFSFDDNNICLSYLNTLQILEIDSN